MAWDGSPNKVCNEKAEWVSLGAARETNTLLCICDKHIGEYANLGIEYENNSERSDDLVIIHERHSHLPKYQAMIRDGKCLVSHASYAEFLEVMARCATTKS